MTNHLKIKEFIEHFPKSPIFRHFIPMEAYIGWPIPLRREGKVYVTLVFYGKQTSSKGVILFPPFSKITLNWYNQKIVEYVDFRFQNPFAWEKWEGAVGAFPHQAIQKWTVGQYEEKRHELLALYDSMFDSLSKNVTLSSDSKNKFSHLLRIMMEPSLEPYYHVLAPKFFGYFLSTKKQTDQ